MIFVFLFRLLLSSIFAALYKYSSSEKIVGIVTGLGDILLSFLCLLIFLCLLSTINYRAVSIDINVEPVSIDYVTVRTIIYSWSVKSVGQ